MFELTWLVIHAVISFCKNTLFAINCSLALALSVLIAVGNTLASTNSSPGALVELPLSSISITSSHRAFDLDSKVESWTMPAVNVFA